MNWGNIIRYGIGAVCSGLLVAGGAVTQVIQPRDAELAALRALVAEWDLSGDPANIQTTPEMRRMCSKAQERATGEDSAVCFVIVPQENGTFIPFVVLMNHDVAFPVRSDFILMTLKLNGFIPFPIGKLEKPNEEKPPLVM